MYWHSLECLAARGAGHRYWASGMDFGVLVLHTMHTVNFSTLATTLDLSQKVSSIPTYLSSQGPVNQGLDCTILYDFAVIMHPLYLFRLQGFHKAPEKRVIV